MNTPDVPSICGMKRMPAWIMGSLVVWILWCFFVIQFVVPAVQRHFTIWAQLIAVVFCLLPILIGGTFLLVRARPTGGSE